MFFIYKALHGMVNCDANDFGLYLKNSCTRGQGIRLQQRIARITASSQLFAVQAPSAWNKLFLASAEVLVCHILSVCLKRNTENSRPLQKMLNFYALLHLPFIFLYIFVGRGFTSPHDWLLNSYLLLRIKFLNK